MTYLIFSLLDLKTGHYSRPFYANHQADAIRDVIALAELKDNHVARHPADFQLMALGMFDDQTGHFHPEAPRSVGVVAGFLAATRPLPLFPSQTAQGALLRAVGDAHDHDGGPPIANGQDLADAAQMEAVRLHEKRRGTQGEV